jgi:hypothetical protein
MYANIPAEVKPTKTSTKMNYDSDFELDFCLMLRERRDTSLAHMKYESIEVEYNILIVDKIRSKDDRDRRKGKSEVSTSSSFVAPLEMDEVTKLLKSLSAIMERVELEGKQSYKNPPNADNRDKFRSPNNNSPQIIQREQRNRDREDQKV